MNMTQKFVLHAKEVKKDKQTFIAGSAEINGKWYKIKFTKECERAPKTNGLYDITVSVDEVSLEKGGTYINKDGEVLKENDILWVRKIADIYKYTDEDLRRENRMKLEGVFGE